MYGTQTDTSIKNHITAFENDVKMYGTQTFLLTSFFRIEFENDVKMYGTQTLIKRIHECIRLRMM